MADLNEDNDTESPKSSPSLNPSSYLHTLTLIPLYLSPLSLSLSHTHTHTRLLSCPDPPSLSPRNHISFEIRPSPNPRPSGTVSVLIFCSWLFDQPPCADWSLPLQRRWYK